MVEHREVLDGVDVTQSLRRKRLNTQEKHVKGGSRMQGRRSFKIKQENTKQKLKP